MNKNIFEIVVGVLKTNSKYISDDGKLLKAMVYSDVMTMNKELLSLLLSDEKIKERFFENVNGTLVFDKQKFAWFIESKEFLPDSYTRYTNKIGLTHNGDFISKSNDVVLDFPYKDCVLEGGQDKDDQKRNEIFYNETIASDEISKMLAPKVFTNAKRYSKDGIEENITFDEKDNLIIKGNNLIALSSLLKRYEGKVKCVYIDPPFNTGSDSFNYNDKFSRSTWLVFMKNRLELAKRLLHVTGNIFVHIDINQSHYLKTLCDGIFGEDNFVEEIIWAYGSPSGGRAATPKPVNIHDYILHYAKSYSERKQNRVYVPYSEKYIKDWFKYIDDDGRKYRRRQRGKDENGNPIWTKQYLDESKGVPLSTVWNDIQQVYADPRAYKDGNKTDVEVLKEFKGGQKPEALIKRILEMATDEGDLVLDFHIGTGTSAATAHKLNRKYIGVEQMVNQIDLILPRLQKVIGGDTAGISKFVEWKGGGSFVYCELLENASTLIEKIQSASEETISEIKSEIYTDERIIPYITRIELEKADEEFNSLELEEKKKALISLVDKNKLYVNYSDIDDESYAINESDKAFTKSFYAEV
ncbi:DNA (cytosine-5-)-methyltransferase [Pseudoramibacter alactolyticus ATCC 23263]|uniref:DNA (Cytosine-5-)-methyltransferase n=1 Tax=Pseudoramibacter alactolyticus ATCC 23263 TaxID=887929 RepID=E6MGK8_9FIRM|nr:site-specific DNA-methyltransferase [Pseudoramibacter alactolyticus]EFV01748.1 DNA (cytosine-5-)-methyltransferase [Pseudoramibacter alactolyticus ATCC 23263]